MSEETIADILAEMFDFSDKRIEEGRDHAMTSESVGLIVHQLAKRFEAAWKRESAGNAAAMREALELALDALISWLNGAIDRTTNRETIKAIRAALSAPARNCDLPDHFQRFKARCRTISCHDCQLRHGEMGTWCAGNWMLAKAEEGGAE